MIVLSSACIPLSKYCELYGESKDAIDKRLQRGIWKVGRELRTIPGVRERWVDLEAVTQWVRQSSKD